MFSTNRSFLADLELDNDMMSSLNSSTPLDKHTSTFELASLGQKVEGEIWQRYNIQLFCGVLVEHGTRSLPPSLFPRTVAPVAPISTNSGWWKWGGGGVCVSQQSKTDW